MPSKRPKTYPITRSDERIVCVTVPENDEGELFDAIREQISPHAVAAIVAYLQPAHTNNPEVDRQVGWFAEQLMQMLGVEQFNKLIEEIGL